MRLFGGIEQSLLSREMVSIWDQKSQHVLGLNRFWSTNDWTYSSIVTSYCAKPFSSEINYSIPDPLSLIDGATLTNSSGYSILSLDVTVSPKHLSLEKSLDEKGFLMTWSRVGKCSCHARVNRPVLNTKSADLHRLSILDCVTKNIKDTLHRFIQGICDREGCSISLPILNQKHARSSESEE